MDRERRRYFRITDEVGIESKPIEEEQTQQHLQDFWASPHEHSLRNEFNYQIQQRKSDLSVIQRKYPEIGRYLEVLQQQMDRLSEKVLAISGESRVEPQQASLSASGIRFYADEKVDRGDMVELKLTLFPDLQKLVIFAKVIDCAKNNDNFPGLYTISLDFEHIHEADREILIRHIHGKQLRALGAARFAEDSDDE